MKSLYDSLRRIHIQIHLPPPSLPIGERSSLNPPCLIRITKSKEEEDDGGEEGCPKSNPEHRSTKKEGIENHFITHTLQDREEENEVFTLHR